MALHASAYHSHVRAVCTRRAEAEKPGAVPKRIRQLLTQREAIPQLPEFGRTRREPQVRPPKPATPPGQTYHF